MSFSQHRLPALSAALFSSAAVLTAAFAGASCNFVIREDDDSFGILCEHHIFPREGDNMWELSRIFLIVGLSLGSLTAALSWSVASYLTPTNFNWSGISVLAAITSVLQIPIFVLFEAEPCMNSDDTETDTDRFFSNTISTTCRLGSGSFLLIASDLLYITVTLITQCLDKPRWGLELDLWRAPKQGGSQRLPTVPRNDEYYYEEDESYDDAVHLRQASSNNNEDEEAIFYYGSRILPASKQSHNRKHHMKNTTKKRGFFSRFLFHSSNSNREVPPVETESINEEDEYDHENQLRVDNSRLLLRPVPTNRKKNRSFTISKEVDVSEGRETSIMSFGDNVDADENVMMDRPKFNQTMPVHEVNIRSFDNIVGADENVMIEHPILKQEIPIRIRSFDENDVKKRPKVNEPMSVRIRSFDQNVMKERPKVNETVPVIIRSFDDIIMDEDVKIFEQKHKKVFGSKLQNAKSPVVRDTVIADDVERHYLIDSPQTSFVDNRNKPLVSSVNDILEDLHSEELVAASFSQSQSVTVKSCSTSDTIILGVRKLSKKLKLADLKRRSNKSVLERYQSRNGGYTPMTNDDEYSDDDEQQYEPDGTSYDENENDNDTSLPSEVKLSSHEDDFYNQARNSGSCDDANRHILDISLDDNLNDDSFIVSINHCDDGAGVPSDIATSPFDCLSIGSSHSDPGPVANVDSINDDNDFLLQINASSGDHSTSFSDIFAEAFMSKSKYDENLITTDNHQLDNHSDFHIEFDSQGRGRSPGKFDGRRKRRPISPVGSIKSHCSSLLQLTINEETEEDIENELSVPYSIKRTFSAPQQRSSVYTGKSTEKLIKKLEKLKRTVDTEIETSKNSVEGSRRKNVNETPNELNKDEVVSSNHITNSQIWTAGNTNIEDRVELSSEQLYGPVEPNEEPKAPQDNSTSFDKGTNECGLSSQNEIPTTSNKLQIEKIPKHDHDVTYMNNVPSYFNSPNNVQPMSSYSPVKHAWKEPEIPTKKVWNELERQNQSRKIPTMPSKEHWIEPSIPTRKNAKNESMDTPFDISDETSDTDGTRSTIYDSDGSSANGSETGSRLTRSKSMSERNKKNRRHKASNSLSPTRPGYCKLDGTLLSNRAREIRIRRMQRLNGYVSLDDKSRAKSSNRNSVESTPKRKTAGLAIDEDNETNEKNLPEYLFQPNLIEPNQHCPEFDTILDKLDLQLIDLRRPVGAEYGDEERSL